MLIFLLEIHFEREIFIIKLRKGKKVLSVPPVELTAGIVEYSQ